MGETEHKLGKDRKGWPGMKNRIWPFVLALSLLTGCAAGAETPAVRTALLGRTAAEEVVIGEDLVALAAAPALSSALTPVASGTKTVKSKRATVDYSNTGDGYVMVNFTAQSDRKLKVKVIGPTTEYLYNITAQEWTTFPLADGNGTYTVKVYEQNPATGKYAVVTTAEFTAAMTDEFAPFLRPNQYVNYANATNTIAKAKELAGNETDPLKLVERVYQYVVNNFTYDKELAATVKSGYLPVLDNVLAAQKGICFDYAAVMAGMLRSLEVPCKLVTGYVPLGNGQTGYHAWISVWSGENGWVEGAIYFDGTTWQRMDPTFASSANRSESIMQYIGDGSNYSVKYVY